ncbi:MAG: hemerythrin family protein [Rhodospirillales bacterium]
MLDAVPEHFKTGVPLIDEQHAEIFSAIILMRSGSESVTAETFSVWIRDIKNLLLAHFAYEEEYMAEIGYPNLEEHKEHHGELVERLTKVACRSKPVPREELDELLDMLIRDMGVADLGLQEFIEGRRHRT